MADVQQARIDPYRIVVVLHEHQRDTSVTSRVKCVCGVTCDDRASHRLHQAELIAHLGADTGGQSGD